MNINHLEHIIKVTNMINSRRPRATDRYLDLEAETCNSCSHRVPRVCGGCGYCPECCRCEESKE